MNCEIGIFVKCPHPEMIEIIGLVGFDYAVIDMEHTPLGPRDLYPLVLAAECHGLSLVVRIPQKLDAYFKWCRDLNVARIQVPHVESAKDALYAIKHSYFSPVGQRGFCRFVRAANYSMMPKDDYLSKANSNNKLVLQIEGKTGLDNLQEIIDVLPADVSIFIGPYDLSQSLGIPGQICDPRVIEAMEYIILQCRPKGLKVGTFVDTPEGINFWLSRGIDFIEYSSDLHLFALASRSLMASFGR